MPTICYHANKEFKHQSPSDKQINKYRLWKCPGCNKWHSLLFKGEK